MRISWISIIILFLSLSVQAQEYKHALAKNGFEHLLLKETKDSLSLFFEHRESRHPFKSMEFANRILHDTGVSDSISKTFIPIYHHVPIGSYSGDLKNYSVPTNEELNYLKEPTNIFKNYRFDLRLHPEVTSRFGYYSDPFETKFNIILDTRIYLYPGLSVQTGLSIPVHNNLDDQSMKLRMAPSMLHYFAQPVSSHFVSASLGTFYSNRYGIDLEYRFSKFDKKWSFGLEAGLTGFYWLNGFSVYHEAATDISFIVDAEYRSPIKNLSLKISGGQFLYQDRGFRLDLIKQYAAAEIGLYASRTDIGTTGGFQFAFSLFPGKLIRTKDFQLRTTEEFRWEYTYNNEEPVAHKYRIGMPRLADILRQYHLDFQIN